MSLRIFNFLIDGELIYVDNAEGKTPARGQEMSFEQSERFVEESKEMLANINAIPADTWNKRSIRIVQTSLSGAGFDLSAEQISKQFGMRTIYAMQQQILEDAGLRVKLGEAGESQAAPQKISTISAAA